MKVVIGPNSASNWGERGGGGGGAARRRKPRPNAKRTTQHPPTRYSGAGRQVVFFGWGGWGGVFAAIIEVVVGPRGRGGEKKERGRVVGKDFTGIRTRV